MNLRTVRTTTALALPGVLLLVLSVGCSSTPQTRAAREEVRAHHNANMGALAAQSAMQDFSVGNLDQALSNIDVAIGYLPENADHHVLKARILIEQLNLNQALKSAQQALKIDPANGDAHYYAGLVFQQWSDDDNAYRHYLAAHEIDTFDEDYLLATVETLVALRRLEEANSIIDLRLPYFEHNASLRRLQGHIAMMQGDPAMAAQLFHKSLLLAPKSSAVVEDLTTALFDSGQFVKCQYYLRKLLERSRESQDSPRADLKHMLAQCLVANDRLIEARDIYLELVDKDPSNPEVWYGLGMLAYQLGDQRRGNDVASRTIHMWPQRFEGYLLRGLLHQAAGRTDHALIDLHAAAERAADESTDSMLLLGLALRKQGDLKRARDIFLKIVQLDPDDARAQQILALDAAELAEVEEPDMLR